MTNRPTSFYTVYRGISLIIHYEKNDIVIWKQKTKDKRLPLMSEENLTKVEVDCCKLFHDNPNIEMSRFLNRV